MDDRDPILEKAATQPDANPFSPNSRTPTGSKRTLALIVGIAFVALLAVGTASAQSVWQVISQFIGLHGKPEPASANVLSEHEIETLDQMSQQAQAQLLLERSINHYHGANDEIAARVNHWQDPIRWTVAIAVLDGAEFRRPESARCSNRNRFGHQKSGEEFGDH